MFEYCMNNSFFNLSLQLILIASFSLSGIILADAFADEAQISSKIIAFENTSIIEFTNHSAEEIKTIKIWISDSSFTSFKSQNDWISSSASINAITFVHSEFMHTNESVKFGLKTDKPYPLVRWDVIDNSGKSVETGITLSESIPSFVNPTEQRSSDDPVILDNSTFKIIPDDLHPGSTIRIIGGDFAPNSSLTLFPIDERSKSFATDEHGNFMLTMKIPENQKPEPVNFILRDSLGNEKIVSPHVTEIKPEFARTFNFTVHEIEKKFDRSDFVELSGSAHPDSPIVIKIKDFHDDLFSTKIENTDSDGNWSSLISFSPNTPLGTYFAEITDGQNNRQTSWDVVASKKLNIFPAKYSFKSGEPISFNGTATPDEPINLTLIDPNGNQVFSKNFIVNSFGFFKIEYPTTSSSLDGTYILYVFQKHDVETIFMGLDTYPKNNLSVKLNDVNYLGRDAAVVGLTGDDSQDVVLSIINENDHEVFSDKLELGVDGKRDYLLDLTTYASGIYTVLVSMASFQTSDIFTVDLGSSHMPINLSMLDTVYYPGDFIHITGNSEPHSEINLLLVDPDGIIINQKETFTDENGNLYSVPFLIPHDELFGKWAVVAESGLNSEPFEFTVNSLGNEGLSIRVTDIISSSVGKFVTLEGYVTEEQSVNITINDPIGNTIFQTNIDTTETGEFDLLWTAPPGVVGAYSVMVTDIFGKTVSTVIDF